LTPARSIAPPAVLLGSLKVSPCNVGVHPLARPEAGRRVQEHRVHPYTIRPTRGTFVRVTQRESVFCQGQDLPFHASCSPDFPQVFQEGLFVAQRTQRWTMRSDSAALVASGCKTTAAKIAVVLKCSAGSSQVRLHVDGVYRCSYDCRTLGCVGRGQVHMGNLG